MKAIHIIIVLTAALVIVGAIPKIGYCIEIRDVDVFLNEKPLRDASTFISPGDVIKVECTVRGKNEFAWVGATLLNPDGRELDFHVSPAHCREGVLGTADTVEVFLSTTVTPDMCPNDAWWPADLSLRLVVQLWKTRVFADDCTIRSSVDGQRPCEYCRKNGYHMEGRIGGAWVRKIGNYVQIR